MDDFTEANKMDQSMRKSNSQSPQAARKFRRAQSSHEILYHTDHNYMRGPKVTVLLTH